MFHFWEKSEIGKKWKVFTGREKGPYSESFRFVFSHIWIEYGDIRSISPYSIQMPKNTDQKNFDYGNFSRSAKLSFSVLRIQCFFISCFFGTLLTNLCWLNLGKITVGYNFGPKITLLGSQNPLYFSSEIVHAISLTWVLHSSASLSGKISH